VRLTTVMSSFGEIEKYTIHLIWRGSNNKHKTYELQRI
jgi:hypothetical protein